jgi:WD40 repeat protein
VLKVWDAATGKESLALRYSPPPAGALGTPKLPGESLLAWGPESQLASAGADGVVTVWDAATGKEVFTLSAPRAPVSSVAWSPDGSRLASAGGGTVTLWDTAAGQEVLSLRTAQPAASRPAGLAWSPDGRRLALSFGSGIEGSVTVWDASPGRLRPGDER